MTNADAGEPGFQLGIKNFIRGFLYGGKIMKTLENDYIVTTDKFAELIGRTRQRVNQLAKEGILERLAPGKYALMKNVSLYIKYLENGQKKPDEIENEAAYWEEKALHEKVKRELAELKLQKARGQVHDAADVERVLTNMLVVFRNRILAIPQKVSPKIIGMTNIAEISEIINAELYEALSELSEYDPAMFAGGEDIETEDAESDEENSQDSGTSTEAKGK